MPMKFKIDALSELKSKGFSTYKLQQQRLFGQSTMQKLRIGAPVDWQIIEKLCKLLQCQPGDILEFVPDSSDETKEQ